MRIADAAKARHLTDFIFGINLSRALVNCLNVSNQNNQYHNLTIGRVQGPTLGFVVNREIKIRSHIPDPLWHISGKFDNGCSTFKANLISAVHKSSDIEKILTSCQNETGVISQMVQRNNKLALPHHSILLIYKKRLIEFSKCHLSQHSSSQNLSILLG